jgi:hypothetical protein
LTAPAYSSIAYCDVQLPSAQACGAHKLHMVDAALCTGMRPAFVALHQLILLPAATQHWLDGVWTDEYKWHQVSGKGSAVTCTGSTSKTTFAVQQKKEVPNCSRVLVWRCVDYAATATDELRSACHAFAQRL